MAPLRQVKPISTLPTSTTNRTTILTRSRATVNQQQPRAKRKADCSPVKENGTKRSAFCDVTNAFTKNKTINNVIDKKSNILQQQNKITSNIRHQTIKKTTTQTKVLQSVKTVVKPKHNENIPPPQAPTLNSGITTRASVKQIATNQTAIKPKEASSKEANKIKTRLSNEFEKTEESVYFTASEEFFSGDTLLSSAKPSLEPATENGKSSTFDNDKKNTEQDKKPTENSIIVMVAQELENKLNLGNHEVPEDVDDFDKENWDDVFQVSHYAMDIFTYLKSRESQFAIPDYMDRQVCLTAWMRSLLIDWMVEVQESFELNHETLYLGVKLVDLYLSQVTVSKETLQLVGAASMFIASKYDERMPPFIDDFLYICDGAYSKRELIRMEINILKVCDFDLGIPISYRFLRRFARCAKISMPVLTLARYILEYSLMDYATVKVRDSILAAASLFLALQMKKISDWTSALEFYSGYKLSDIKSTVYLLNNGLHRKHKTLMTIHNKYSHKIFYEVAKTPTLTNEELKL